MDAVTRTRLPALDELGYAAISPDRLDILVSSALGQPVQVATLRVDPVDYPNGSIATGALLRCAGTAVAAGGDHLPWRLFVKQLQTARVWPLLHVVPAFVRQQFIDAFPWRTEIDAYRSGLPALFDPGMRLPTVHDVIEIDDDRAAIWMEDVVPSPLPWDDDRFARAARHLGALAGRRRQGTDVVFGPPDFVDRPGAALRMLVDGRIRMGAATLLRDDSVWRHPAVLAALAATGEDRIRDELVAALDRIDDWLAQMDTLPQTHVHGDASPQNLLVPAEEPGSFVVIDFGFNSLHCVGFDLGQLLVGLPHAGQMDVDRLDDVRRVILAAYGCGLRSTGFDASAAEIEQGFLLAVVVRSMFTAVPLETLGQPDSPGLRDLLIDRLRLTRYLLACAAEITR